MRACRNSFVPTLVFLTGLIFSARSEAAVAFDTKARNVFIEDYDSGQVLFDKAGEERIPTASMSKMMTAYVVFEELKKGHFKLTDEFPVSQHAWRAGGSASGGSTMFLPLNGHAKVEDLLRGMIIQSGNDACIVLAEGIAGSEEAFVRMMNEDAQKMGLTGTHFANADGLPDPQHYSTAHDLAQIAIHLIRDFPEYYHYFSEIDFTYGTDARGKPIKQGNRNPLLYTTPGTDGVKTGHTEEAGFCLTASAKRDGRRIIMVATHLDSMKNRSEEGARIMEWAFHNFQSYALVKKGEEFDKADVWLGQAPKVPLVAANDVSVTLPREARDGLKVSMSYDNPVKAPVVAGTPVGSLTITAPDTQPIVVPLVAGTNVAELGMGGRMSASLSYLLHGAKS